ncbi:TPA: hypothetical protein ACXKAZ_001823 [Pseudomonas aeruginosa]|nr:hypothetical protein [Pseudomonas aeruginosa]HEJ1837287.1 hypothetical protein [Pseudomonas aeruginosa]HEK3577540.1 hypothetical protein [Pseudomonas aeruginosa]HEK3590429.1 hypothetical protein [Pseudomonas aeruginosa]HEQ2037077.1 hypothetical protein [Pseudomonas aeruginosa]
MKNHITTKDKKKYLREVRAMIVELVESKIDTNLKSFICGNVSKKTSNAGFIKKSFEKYTKKFYLQHSMVVPKREPYDMLAGKEATELDIAQRNYRVGYSIYVLNAFDEVMERANEKIGYKIQVKKDISMGALNILYDDLKEQMEEMQKKG